MDDSRSDRLPQEWRIASLTGLGQEAEACPPRGIEDNEGAIAKDGFVDQGLIQAVKKELIQRSDRERYFPASFFGEPGWNILVDLYLASATGRSVTVTDACIASRGSKTTALRWIELMIREELIERRQSGADGRVTYLRLTGPAKAKVTDYFSKR